ncbi:mismatched base pair and cruciform DNA recognition protein, partial [Pisolithus sp. B1]
PYAPLAQVTFIHVKTLPVQHLPCDLLVVPARLIIQPQSFAPTQVGDTTGASSWSQSGKEEHSRGEGEYKAAQAKGYVEGLTDKAGGYKDSVVGAVSGDKDQQVQGKSQV